MLTVQRKEAEMDILIIQWRDKEIKMYSRIVIGHDRHANIIQRKQLFIDSFMELKAPRPNFLLLLFYSNWWKGIDSYLS